MTTIYTDGPLPGRAPFDFYPTPLSHVQATFEAVLQADEQTFNRDALLLQPGLRVCDPSAGHGAYAALKEQMPGTHWTGVEVRDVVPDARYDEWVHADFLRWQSSERFDLVIGNPPYGKVGDSKARDAALQFVRHGLHILKHGGLLAYLLRLEFLASRSRAVFFDDTPPALVMICPARPSFTGNGKVAPNEYAVIVWKKGRTDHTSICWSRTAR